MATQFDWEGFRALAGRLDKLIANGATDIDGNDTLAEELRKALAFLYTAGVSMPSAGDVFEDAGGEGFWERSLGDAEETDSAAAEQAVTDLAERLRASVEALQPDEDDTEDIDELLWIAAHNIEDVRTALAAGIAHFEDGRLKEASWEWSFGFDDWGAHALAGMTALHELLWGAL